MRRLAIPAVSTAIVLAIVAIAIAWGPLTAASAATTVTRIQQTDSRIAYSGTWATATGTHYSGGSVKYSTVAGSSALLTFNGTSCSWIGTKSSQYGSAYVSLDGHTAVRVNLTSSTTLYQQTLYSTGALAAGTHTLRITCVTPKISVDAFDISTATSTVAATGAATTTLAQQTDSRIAYSGTWATATGTHYSGGSVKYSTVAGSSALLTFNGTSCSWIGTKSSQYGSAYVSLDGHTAVRVNLTSSTTLYQQTLYSTGALAAGTHTLRITCVTPKISVDAFAISNAPVTTTTSTTTLATASAASAPTTSTASSTTTSTSSTTTSAPATTSTTTAVTAKTMADLQNIIDSTPSGGTAYLPAGTYVISPSALQMRSGVHVVGAGVGKTILQGQANALTWYAVVMAKGIHDASLEGVTIIGDRASHQATGGEYGMGLAVVSTQNVTIKNVAIRDNWGDGLYVSWQWANNTAAGANNQNLTVSGVVSQNNRRCAGSIAGLKGGNISNSQFLGSNGTMPMDGMDLEPDSGWATPVNDSITFTNCDFSSCTKEGLSVFYWHNTNITFQGCRANSNGTVGYVIDGDYVTLNNCSATGNADDSVVLRGNHISVTGGSYNGYFFIGKGTWTVKPTMTDIQVNTTVNGASYVKTIS